MGWVVAQCAEMVGRGGVVYRVGRYVSSWVGQGVRRKSETCESEDRPMPTESQQ